MNQINRNFAGSEEYSADSFVGQFHEQRIWDDDAYLELENHLYDACEKYKGQENMPRAVIWPVMQIYGFLMMSIGCHLDANDGFEIKNLSREQIYERRERLQMIFEGFFTGKMPDKECFG